MPRHVAIIMDGSGRWASERGLSWLDGQAAGIRAQRDAIWTAAALGIPYLTLHSFSAGSFEQPRDQRQAELELLAEFADGERERFRDRGIRLNVVGSLDDFSSRVRRALERLAHHTAAGAAMTVSLALSYRARQDIVDAARCLAIRVCAGLALAEEIDDASLREQLATRDLPAVDVLIRTGGESRLSDSLLFEAANAELVFLQTMWPEFDAETFRSALEARNHELVGHGAAQLFPGCVQPEIANAASDAGPALGLTTVGSREPGASRMIPLQGPFD